jgi:hypothetical protein
MRRFCLVAVAVAVAAVVTDRSWAGEQEALADAAQRQALAAQVVRDWEAVQTRTVDGAWKEALRARIAEQYTLAELQAVSSGSLPQPSLPDDGVATSRLGDSQADLVYTPVAPCRIVDTRVAGGILTAGSTRDFWVTGTGFGSQGGTAGFCGVPFGPATAAMLNFVATSSAGPGNLQAWPYAGTVPTASTLNYGSVTGLASIANGLAIPICDPSVSTCTRDFTVKANNSNTHVVVDVVGYFSKSASNVVQASSALLTTFAAPYVDCITSAYDPAVDERVAVSSVSPIVGSASGTVIYAQNVYSTDGGTTWLAMSLEGQLMRITTVGGAWVPLPNISFMNLTAGNSYQFGIRYVRETGAATITDGRCELLVVPR